LSKNWFRFFEKSKNLGGENTMNTKAIFTIEILVMLATWIFSILTILFNYCIDLQHEKRVGELSEEARATLRESTGLNGRNHSIESKESKSKGLLYGIKTL
jgi:hypothetical protein